AGPHTLNERGEMGGKGMMAVYDELYPRNLGKILKRLDPTIEEPKTEELWSSADDHKLMSRRGRSIHDNAGIQFHTFPLTDQIKNRVREEGLAQFAISPKGRRLGATGTAAQWINRYERVVADWQKVLADPERGMRELRGIA